jgi:hypothetical protein
MIKTMFLTLTLAAAGSSMVGGLARAQTGRDACGPDVEKYCKDVPAGHGGRYKCLKGHENELSAPCKAALQPKQ